jgi:hypothetical protein
MPQSLWSRVADLPLAVDAHAAHALETQTAEERASYLIRLQGDGAEGLGEDVGGDMLDENGAFLAAAPSLPLAGRWTLASFCEHLAALDLWPEPPAWEMAHRWRRWAFESAALDLALAQAGLGLPEALGRVPAPVRFVNSLGLGDPPEHRAIGRRLAQYPDLRFKLDADASWSPSLAAAVAATGAVDVIDFKGRYALPIEDEALLLASRPSRTSRRPRSGPGSSTSSRRASAASGRCSTSTSTASATACGCTAAGWASSASRAARSSCSPRSSIPTAPTTWLHRRTTCPTSRPVCPRARSSRRRA